MNGLIESGYESESSLSTLGCSLGLSIFYSPWPFLLPQKITIFSFRMHSRSIRHAVCASSVSHIILFANWHVACGHCLGQYTYSNHFAAHFSGWPFTLRPFLRFGTLNIQSVIHSLIVWPETISQVCVQQAVSLWHIQTIGLLHVNFNAHLSEAHYAVHRSMSW